MSDITMQTTAAALDGLSHRARVRADNIANAETPGYRAREVNFETALSEALRDPRSARVEESYRDNAVDARGNSVDLEIEVTEMVQDNLLVQAMVNGFNYKVGMLRSAMGN